MSNDPDSDDRVSSDVDAPEPRPHVRVSTVATNGMPKDIVKRGSTWNFGPGSLWTHNGWQYAAYWDDQCQVSVARRQLPKGAWSVISLPGYKRTENIDRGKAGPKSQGFGDSHEKVAMGISADGVIHLAFDHHVSTLHYRRSKTSVATHPMLHPWTTDLFEPVKDHLGGPTIEAVTYPCFTRDGDRLLLYLRLNGGSGSADSHFFEYANGQWQINDFDASKLIDKHWSGGNGTVNAYPHGLIVRDGRRHLTWCWRDTPVASTCHDLCYAYSDDHGKTWLNNDGVLIGVLGKQFINADSPGVAVFRIPPGTRYQNGGSMTVDARGRVHVLMRGEDGQPAYFQRDPGTKQWTRGKTDVLGTLVAGDHDRLYVVADGNVLFAPAEDPSKLSVRYTGNESLFTDSKPSVDAMCGDLDRWISVIGQSGTTVSVADYDVAENDVSDSQP
ncbi:BNR repeat-containing protein [Novipirellula artificiosorum]|nr:BNR repeat-containing protein [Novipirellula artificiosorum]